MSRYDHFRQWLSEQAPRSAPTAPSPARARYTLPEYRLPPVPDPRPRTPTPTVPPPLWVDPQGMAPPVFASQDLSTPSVHPGGVNLPSLPPPRAIASTPPRTVYTASLSESRPSLSRHSASPPVQPEPPRKPPNRAIRRYSYGLVFFVWLSLLGIGGYATNRLLDPVFVSPQPGSETPSTPSQTASPAPSIAQTPTPAPQPVVPSPRSTPPQTAAAIAPVPVPFEYADATPQPNTSPIWALVAVITASALGSRLMGHHAQQRSRHR